MSGPHFWQREFWTWRRAWQLGLTFAAGAVVGAIIFWIGAVT